MRVLVTGGCGFIGRHSVELLLQRGYEVRVLDSLRSPVHSHISLPSQLPADVEVVIGDVCDATIFGAALNKVDLVIHLAAHQDYLLDFSTFFKTNVTGTALLYELIVRQSIPVQKVVVASSQAVYGEGTYQCDEHGQVWVGMRGEHQLQHGLWEVVCPTCGNEPKWSPSTESRTGPVSVYGVSKLSQEQVAMTLGARYGIRTTCLRYSIAHGRWQSPSNAYSGICRIFVQRAIAGKPLVLYEDGQQVRDYIYVGDVASANLLALEDSRADFEVYNVGGANITSVREYAALVLEVLDRDLPIETPGIYRIGDSRHLVSSSERIQALGWRPSLVLPEIVRQYATWLVDEDLVLGETESAMEYMTNLGVLRHVLPR